jgi:hypothetical protein
MVDLLVCWYAQFVLPVAEFKLGDVDEVTVGHCATDKNQTETKAKQPDELSQEQLDQVAGGTGAPPKPPPPPPWISGFDPEKKLWY